MVLWRMTDMELNIRLATQNDLADLNDVIERAVMAWPLADRVKRLALFTMQYDEQDLKHLEIFAALLEGNLIGVASWDPDHESTLFHGLYIDPRLQGKGIGKQLMDHVFSRAKSFGRGSMLIRAERVSAAYFAKEGLAPIETAETEYPYQFKKWL